MNQLNGRTRKEYITFAQRLCSLSGKLVAYTCRARKGCILVALQLNSLSVTEELQVQIQEKCCSFPIMRVPEVQGVPHKIFKFQLLKVPFPGFSSYSHRHFPHLDIFFYLENSYLLSKFRPFSVKWWKPICICAKAIESAWENGIHLTMPLCSIV